MDSCLPEYVQSLFVARADHFTPADELAGDAGCSLPKASSSKEPIAKREPTGDAEWSLPRTDQSEHDASTSKEKSFDIEDSPKMENIFTHATAPEGHTI